MKRLILVATAAVVFVAVAAGGASALVAGNLTTVTTKKAGPGGNGGDNGIHDTRGTQTQECGDGDVIVYDGPVKAWPPNHKYRNVTISAIDGDGSGHPVSLETAGTHDQIAEDGTEMNGAGNTDPATDVMPPAAADTGDGIATTQHQFRGERSGRDKSGRTYTFDALAEFDDKTCSAQFTSHVPHDMRGGGGRDHNGKPRGSRRRG